MFFSFSVLSKIGSQVARLVELYVTKDDLEIPIFLPPKFCG